MKKLLITTAALVATAGVAAADGHAGVKVTGDARMGVINDGTDTKFSSRVRISFAGSGETDNGLSFGGSIRADNAGDGASGTAGSAFIGGENWKASMGDVDSGMKAAIGQVDGVGYTGAGDFNEIDYIATTGDTDLLLQFSFSGATIYASVGQINLEPVAGVTAVEAVEAVADDPLTTDVDETVAAVAAVEGVDAAPGQTYSIGVKYATDTFNVAIGMEDQENNPDAHFGIGLGTTLGGVGLKATYGKNGDNDQYALSASYTSGALTGTAFVSKDLADEDGYGIGVAYDLGGGAAVKAGYASQADVDRYGLGLTFSF